MRSVFIRCIAVALCTALMAAVTSADTTSTPTDFSVWGYLPEYRLGGFNYEAAFQTGMTHLIFFSLEIDIRTGLPSAKDRLPTKEAAKEARKAADRVGGKVILSFGGNARSQGFPTAAATKQSRTKFLVALNKILQEYEFDGVDYNWEYPRNDAEWHQWAHLLRESKQYLLNPKVVEYWALVAEGKKAAAASGSNTVEPEFADRKIKLWKSIFSPDQSGSENYHRNLVTFTMYLDPRHYDVIMKYHLLEDADMVHCMAYDARGEHSTFDFAKQGIQLARQKFGAHNLKKFTLGVPFYGRHIDNGEPITWYDLVDKVPNLDADVQGRYYFNGHSMLKEKTRISIEAQIGGLMIWEMGQDKQPVSDPRSLMSAIFKVTSTLPQTPASMLEVKDEL